MFLTIPDGPFTDILLLLGIPDLCSLRLTCKSLHRHVNESDKVWNIQYKKLYPECSDTPVLEGVRYSVIQKYRQLLPLKWMLESEVGKYSLGSILYRALPFEGVVLNWDITLQACCLSLKLTPEHIYHKLFMYYDDMTHKDYTKAQIWINGSRYLLELVGYKVPLTRLRVVDGITLLCAMYCPDILEITLTFIYKRLLEFGFDVTPNRLKTCWYLPSV